jgi:signal peptidase I
MESVPPSLPDSYKKPRPWWVVPVVWSSLAFALLTMAGLSLLLYFRLSDGYRFYRVPSNGMAPTISKGDHVLGLARNSGLEQLRQCDVIIFHMIETSSLPGYAGSIFIQRTAALPGQHVQLLKDKVLVDGKEFMIKTEHGELHYAGSEGQFQKDFIVPPGQVFTLGDNTHNSFDGRFWGLLPADRIFQKGVYRVAPASRIGPVH